MKCEKKYYSSGVSSNDLQHESINHPNRFAPAGFLITHRDCNNVKLLLPQLSELASNTPTNRSNKKKIKQTNKHKWNARQEIELRICLPIGRKKTEVTTIFGQNIVWPQRKKKYERTVIALKSMKNVIWALDMKNSRHWFMFNVYSTLYLLSNLCSFICGTHATHNLVLLAQANVSGGCE